MGRVHKLSLLLVIPALAAIHAASISALIAMNSAWSLNMAQRLSFNNADVAYAQAEFYRFSDSQKSLDHWLAASELRPEWPYYQLGALDAEVRLGVDDQGFQQRLQRILVMAPHERGLDAGLFELALLRWDSMTTEQKLIIAGKLNDTPRKNLTFALQIAEQVQKKDLICGIVSPKRTRGLCY